MSTQSTKEPLLLPRYFKYAGLILFLAVIAAAFILKLVNEEWFKSKKDILKIMAMNAGILSICFIAFSKDKIEDEMTLSLRLRSISQAMLIGVSMVIVMPVINMLQDKPYYEDFSAQNLVMFTLLFYIFLYHFRKKMGQ